MESQAHGKASALERFWQERGRKMQYAALACGVGVVVAASAAWLLSGDVSDVERWKDLGYPGVFFLSFLASVSLVLPVPGLVSLCGVSLLLNPLALGLLAAIAETLGEISGYAIGYGGSTVVEDRAVYKKIRGWMERRGVLVIFLVSAIPNPIFDLVGIAAGGVRFPITRFLLTVLAGKIIKCVAVAYSCYYGVSALPWIS